MELEYRGFYFWMGGVVDVAQFDVARQQIEGRRPYGNNFVFVPREA